MDILFVIIVAMGVVGCCVTFYYLGRTVAFRQATKDIEEARDARP